MSTRPVAMYEGKTLVAKYTSIAYAAEMTGTQPAHIGKVANGLRESAGGYGWKSLKTFGSKLSPKRPGIAQCTKDGDVIAVYADADTASSLTGIKTNQINDVVKGSKSSAGGYVWTKA